MKARALIILLTLESVLHACSHAFVLRKRSAWDQNTLSDALQLVERERQRLGEEEDPEESWEVPSEKEREKELLLGRLLQDGSEGDQLSDEMTEPEYLPPQLYDDGNDQPMTRKRKKSSSSVDMDELRSILGPYADEQYSADVKRTAGSDEGAYDNDYRKRLYDPSQDDVMDYEKKDTPSEVMTPGNDLSSTEVSNLLNEVESVENGAISREAISSSDEKGTETSRQAEVSKDELEDVLKDDEDEEDDGIKSKPEIVKPSTVITTKPNGVTVTKTEQKEWPSVPAKAISVTEESVMFSPPKGGKVKRTKHKRSGDAPTRAQSAKGSATSTESAAEIARKYLKVFLQLEDDENNNLANALNIATLSQIKRTDKYIPEEIKYLRKAILDEEMIQKLDDLSKTDLEEPESESSPDSSTSDEDTATDEVPLIRKRKDPVELAFPRKVPDIPDGIDREDLKNLFRKFLIETGKLPEDQSDTWYDRPVAEEFEGGSEGTENTLNPFLRELMKAYEAETGNTITTKRANLLPDTMPGEESDVEGGDSAEAEAEAGAGPESSEETDAEITSALADYVEGLSSSERRELSAAVEDKLAVETCPAVRELSDNCALMDEFKLTVDDEARNLCNRHQLCYSCGAANGRSRGDCDAGYLEEAKSLCESEKSPEKCKDEAAGMFLLMSKMHTYVPFTGSDESCAAPCVMRYVIGPNAK